LFFGKPTISLTEPACLMDQVYGSDGDLRNIAMRIKKMIIENWTK